MARRCTTLVAALLLLLAACTGATGGSGSPAPLSGGVPGGSSSGSTSSTADPSGGDDSTSSSPGPSGGAGSAGPACPAVAAQPDPGRPAVELSFDVADDLRTVSGVETVRFSPDLPIDRLVFRLTANTASSVQAGNRVDVRSAQASPGGLAPTYEAAGAAATTQGGLLIIPLDRTAPPGTTVSATIEFAVTLGADSFDRFGRSAGYAWFASAQPLLAWERGVGWHTEPMLQFTAESATSEAATTALTVIAPRDATVLMTGNPTTSTPAPGGRATWRATQDAARDVSVAVGPFQVQDTTAQDSSGRAVPVRVGAPTEAAAASMTAEFVRAVAQLSGLLGPFPFPALSVARLPGGGGGIEYPGAILMLDASRLVAVHEAAHQWFYAMVGNSQAQHAWLDEAFASWAEQVVDGDPPPDSALQLPGPVDKPTADYGTDDRAYYSITYDKGAAALHAASAAAGDDAFRAAIRCYLKARAWTVSHPSDVEAALADLPAAVRILQDAGALP